jgi:hypothetical protein
MALPYTLGFAVSIDSRINNVPLCAADAEAKDLP